MKIRRIENANGQSRSENLDAALSQSTAPLFDFGNHLKPFGETIDCR